MYAMADFPRLTLDTRYLRQTPIAAIAGVRPEDVYNWRRLGLFNRGELMERPGSRPEWLHSYVDAISLAVLGRLMRTAKGAVASAMAESECAINRIREVATRQIEYEGDVLVINAPRVPPDNQSFLVGSDEPAQERFAVHLIAGEELSDILHVRDPAIV